ncbi:MAG TPA: redoxin domain-containing protein [Bryobacteraceae bacterium]|nr:redoxin domain-containing protein [Bryobacteraceae bacterium]
MTILQNPLRLAGIGAVAVLLGLVACSPTQQPVKHVVRDESQRKQAPDFALKDANGKLVHLADFKGKVVVLDFWATWCNPCMVEIPWFQEFERKYKDRGFEVLGVSMDDDGWKAINPFVAKRKLNYRVVLGDDKTGDQFGGLEALPTTFVIDRNGRIASAHVGLPLAGKKDFEDAIQQLLEAPALPDDGGAVRSDARRPDGPDAVRRRATHG